MLDHVSLPVSDLDRSAQFYDAVLAPLGLVRRKEIPGAVGFGAPDQLAPSFWLLASHGPNAAKSGLGLHVSFGAKSSADVDAFHQATLGQGARDAGAPGPRPEYTQPFYGAFALDPDGFKIEAVCRSAV
jgi:catechol 2,3-dioxygenase-like lactoylglutathione lyase family enzyme